jgi:uncharacterized membrane protein YtjA (UPF0391 family)
MTLLRWAVLFAVIALIAGILGFGGVAGASWEIAKVLFWIFLAIFVILLLMDIFAARTVAGP